ncbi:hypothetical protein BC939DRAFT_442622 [Gamsiella multidivaricata]|uniref:uncharacterized protein n=1 Tax=Gamsiella multidivaricata TaxID=101098 RepID=UPI002220FA13|nr:uncharacterized protein BC939DRAFT_442622 [Gamsiella multidivaricata]KAI7828691.1 hypothetical protein BC939DRAFT_442622 [Gamsiella multidivaricata]
MSSISQQRSASPMMHSSISSQHLNPHSHSHSHAACTSYASSISPSPCSRPSSPASMIGSTYTVPTPPQSPTSFHLKSFASTPGSPTAPNSNSGSTSTVITLGSQPVGSAPSSDPSSNPSSVFNLSVGSLLSQPVTRFVVLLTLLQSLVALGGHFPDHCTAPSHVLYAGQYAAMIASPFVVPLTPALLVSAQQTLGTSLLLAISNIISLALFEERLTTIFNGNGSRIFRNLFLTIVALVLASRQLLGFIFSRSLGWQFPALFFSDSMHECNLACQSSLTCVMPAWTNLVKVDFQSCQWQSGRSLHDQTGDAKNTEKKTSPGT